MVAINPYLMLMSVRAVRKKNNTFWISLTVTNCEKHDKNKLCE